MEKLGSFLGNISFIDDLIYEQDQVEILDYYLNGSDITESKQMIDNLIECFLKHLEFGFLDRVFNFAQNYGVNQYEEIILIDFGEIEFDKDKVKELVRLKFWENSWSFRKKLDKELKIYLCHRMNSLVTENTVEKLWKKEQYLLLYKFLNINRYICHKILNLMLIESYMNKQIT